MRTKSRMIILLATGFLICLGCSSNEDTTKAEVERNSCEKGRIEARRDLSNGKLRVPFRGSACHRQWYWDYQTEASKRFGVEFIWVGSCAYNEELMDWEAGYYEVMNAEIERRFGVGALDNLYTAYREEAEKNGTELLDPNLSDEEKPLIPAREKREVLPAPRLK